MKNKNNINTEIEEFKKYWKESTIWQKIFGKYLDGLMLLPIDILLIYLIIQILSL